MSAICIIIGASHAGSQLALSLRQEGWEGRILVITDDAHMPYHRPPLSKGFIADDRNVSDIALRSPTAYADKHIEFLLNSHVEAVDREAKTIMLANGESLAYNKLALATGSRVRRLEAPGSDLAGVHYLRNAKDAEAIRQGAANAKHVVIIGGGYIACEFACIMNGLGVETTQYYRGAQILRGFDDEARGHIAEMIQGRGVNLHVGTDAARIEKRDDGLWVKATDGREATFDAVVYATGRLPNSSGLGLEELGVAMGRKGEIEVDDYSQTSVPSIYAVGDVTDRINLTPIAIREGAAFVETVFNGNPTKPDHDVVPSAVFTQPEYGSVGLTEEQARDAGPIEVYSAAFRPMQLAFIGKDERVFYKLIVCADTRKILGAHIIAPGAGEMIQMVGVAVKMGATKEDFDRTVAVHPTMSEEIVLMKTPVRTA